MAQGLPVFPNFSVREPAVDTRWKKWCARLENLLVGLDIKDDKRKRALLLHYVGEEVNEIFDTLPDTSDDYATALDKLRMNNVRMNNLVNRISQDPLRLGS